VRRREVLRYYGPEPGECTLATAPARFTFQDDSVLSGWVKILLTDRRLVFEGVTWQLRLSDIKLVSVLPRTETSRAGNFIGSLALGVLVSLIPVVGPGLAGGAGSGGSPNTTDVCIELRDGRTMTLAFGRKKDAKRLVAALTQAAHVPLINGSALD
jgi:hypothetical protein